jgi:hypothetical protein
MVGFHRGEPYLARARAALLSVHAHLVQEIATRLGGRLSTARIVRRYCQANGLSDFDELWLRIQAIAHAGTGRTIGSVAAVSGGALGSLLAEVRAGIAPHGDSELQERLTCEFAAARAIVLKVHIRNAVGLARALAPAMTASAAVAFYIHELDVPHDLSGAVFALALTHLDRHSRSGMLPSGNAGRGPAQEPETNWQQIEELVATNSHTYDESERQ